MSTAFLSYSYDDDPHVVWTRSLTARLKGDGIAVTLDQGRRVPPAELPGLMASAVQSHEYVLVICTPKYRALSEGRWPDAGYQGDVMTAGMVTTGNQRKFIPVLRQGTWADAGPLWLSEYYIDLRDGPRFEAKYQDLLATLRGVKGRMSRDTTEHSAPLPEPEPEPDPVKILGVITEEVGVPRLDGTPMGYFYRVPLKLSKQVPPQWEALFERNWNHSPRFAALRRASIALVNQDRIVLSCTTLEEVLKDHRMMLVECVNVTNKMVREKELETKRREEEWKRRQQDHKRHIQELAEQIRFDD